MSSASPATPRKRNKHTKNCIKSLHEDNNNVNKSTERQQARTFISWYRHLVDNERGNLTLYLSDDVILEWFGRTIKTRKKVTAFLKNDMQCSRHDFTTVESIDKVWTRQERLTRQEDTSMSSPLNSPDIIHNKPERSIKRRALRSNCNSPEWAEGCNPDNDFKSTDRKRLKSFHNTSMNVDHDLNKKLKGDFDDSLEISSKGDCGKRLARRYMPETPPNHEVGQGDCLPSTSGTDSDKSHEVLNAQLPKLAVECKGFVEFSRTRHNRSTDAMKWERKCKLQISYSKDPLNIGEYIIWSIHYTDESKCRRNLLAAFEEVAREEKTNV